MNLIEKLNKIIQSKMPEVSVQLDRPAKPEGIWCLDLRLNNHLVVVEWRPGQGFSVSSGEGGYGERPDELFTSVSQVEARVKELLTHPTETQPSHAVLVQRLRELRGLTQMQLAERMGIKQATLSRLERGDMHLSTLQRLVASMGGELQIQAIFQDRIIPLGNPPTPKVKVQRRASRKTPV